MSRTAKVFMTNRSQAVRLPKEFQFSTDEVLIRKVGDDVILSPRPRDWRSYLESAPVASDAFMAEVEDLPVQERETADAALHAGHGHVLLHHEALAPAGVEAAAVGPVDDVCMSVVTKAELLYGVEVSPRRAQDAAALAAFLPYVEARGVRRGRGTPLRGDPCRPEAARCDDRRQRPLHRRACAGTRPDAGDEQHR